jgi:hypothetical protein
MKSNCICAFAVYVPGTAVYAGNVMATPSSGLMTTILAKSLLGQIDVKATLTPPEPDSSIQAARTCTRCETKAASKPRRSPCSCSRKMRSDGSTSRPRQLPLLGIPGTRKTTTAIHRTIRAVHRTLSLRQALSTAPPL